MSVLRITYPITQGAKKALANYPQIAKKFSMPESRRSKLEILRLLSNTHYGHIERLLEFIDKWLNLSGPIGEKVLTAKHPFRLEQYLAELYLFAHLYEQLGNTVRPVRCAANKKCPDIEVDFSCYTVKIEVYTPVELTGFQIFERYVPMILKYLDIPRGYLLHIKTEPLSKKSGYDPKAPFYPYTIPDENQTRAWLAQFSERTAKWMSKPNPEPALEILGPGGKIKLMIQLVQCCGDADDREIHCVWATRSTDTSLFFRVGSPQNTATSEWGSKLKKKLEEQQCGPPVNDILRMLVLNFCMADMAYPEFISQKRFTTRFEDTLKVLVHNDELCDVVLPAQLGTECCFGKPAWLGPKWQEQGDHFISQARLDTPCQPCSAPRLNDMSLLLEDLVSE